MNKNKKRNRIYYLLILLVAITVGYAALSTQLKINGNATITKNIWNVYWDPESVVVTQGSKGSTIPTVGNSEDGSTNTKVTWSVNFELPGDFYEFTVDAANAGTLDAMINTITPTIPQDLPDYVSYSVTYADGKPIVEKHLLAKGTKSGNTITPTTEKYKLRIEFLDTITPTQMNAIPEDGLNFDFGYEVKYGQADDTAISKPTTLQNDSWETIAANVRKNKKSYNLGETKTFDMDMSGSGTIRAYTVRVANNTTPEECSQTGFSQTACGFVLEFQDLLYTDKMNARNMQGVTVGKGNVGGWEASKMRAILNDGLYMKNTEYEKDYSVSGGLYDKLPADIRNVIIDTTVVSGYGFNDASHGNFVTTDKLYLLDAKEVFGDSFNTSTHAEYNTAKDNERQLDYYFSQDVIYGTKWGVSSKKNMQTDKYGDWWLRSAFYYENEDDGFFIISRTGSSTGGLDNEAASSGNGAGVSPAFRIAE